MWLEQGGREGLAGPWVWAVDKDQYPQVLKFPIFKWDSKRTIYLAKRIKCNDESKASNVVPGTQLVSILRVGVDLGRGYSLVRELWGRLGNCRDQLRSMFNHGEHYRWHGSLVENREKLENILLSRTRPR